jgi:hypothetical protein
MSRYRDDDDDIDADPDERYRRGGRRYYDDPDDDPDNLDRDADAEYRRRVRRYGEETTDEEEEQTEKDEAESGRVARRKCLVPGILMTAAGALTLAGAAGFVAVVAATIGAAPPGAGPAAAATTVISVCAGIPLLIGLVGSGFQLGGGICLLRRRARGMAICGAILGCMSIACILACGLMSGFPPPIWLALGPALLGIPAAIWMFAVLQDHDVQAAFESRQYG